MAHPERVTTEPDRGSDREPPPTPTRLRSRSWYGVLRRTVKEFRADPGPRAGRAEGQPLMEERS
jgi:hypothetical protein